MIEIDDNNNVSIKGEAHDNCELCGTKAELRPYGPNRERICVTCGRKDLETTYRMINEAVMQSLEDKGISLQDVNRIAYEKDDGSEVVLFEDTPSPNGKH
jgi:hypothetical protein